MGTTALIVRLASKRAPYLRGGFKFESTRTPIDADPSTLTEVNARRLHADAAITISVVQPATETAKESVIAVLPQRLTLEQLVAGKPAIGPAFPWVAANAKALADGAQAEADAKAQEEQDAAEAIQADADAKAEALAKAATAAVQTALAGVTLPPNPAPPPSQDGAGGAAAADAAKAAAGGKAGKASA